MHMDIDRADMKLLIETGYSSVLRNLDADATAIFEAIDTWMPDYAAGQIGTALQSMVAGQFEDADVILNTLVATKKHGKGEARAMLALCKALKDEWEQAEELAGELEGDGSSAETFTRLLVHGPTPEELAESEGMAMARTAAE